MDNRAFQAHHAHPTPRIRVAIESQARTLDLGLGRDSSVGIARVRTAALARD
jgi:hypothetical protein